MKKLDFNEMEMVNGGIACADVSDVLVYLANLGPKYYPQIDAILEMYNSGGLQCSGAWY